MPGDLDHPEDLEDGEDAHQPLDVGEPALLLLLPLLHLLPGVLGQFEEEEKPYRGQLVGSLNSYHHQVNWDQQPKRSKLHLLLAFSTSTKYPKLRLIGIRMLHSEGLKP